ncbi:MAG: hypothetical protein ISR78_01535 [Spirochaetia bacterium]|nr:hypothetical protein [Spirochaetia bacterium]
MKKTSLSANSDDPDPLIANLKVNLAANSKTNKHLLASCRKESAETTRFTLTLHRELLA